MKIADLDKQNLEALRIKVVADISKIIEVQCYTEVTSKNIFLLTINLLKELSRELLARGLTHGHDGMIKNCERLQKTLSLLDNKQQAHWSIAKKSTQEVMLQYNEMSKKLAMSIEQLSDYATHDFLTGLYNRRYFQKKLEDEISRYERHSRPFALILFDVDKFKTVNDTYGHSCGDELLKKTGEFLEKNIRKSDVLARIGGDEFALLLVETTLSDARKFIKKINPNLQSIAFIDLKDQIHHGSITSGVAEYNPSMKTLENFCDSADKDLYINKSGPKGKK